MREFRWGGQKHGGICLKRQMPCGNFAGNFKTAGQGAAGNFGIPEIPKFPKFPAEVALGGLEALKMGGALWGSWCKRGEKGEKGDRKGCRYLAGISIGGPKTRGHLFKKTDALREFRWEFQNPGAGRRREFRNSRNSQIPQIPSRSGAGGLEELKIGGALWGSWCKRGEKG